MIFFVLFKYLVILCALRFLYNNYYNILNIWTERITIVIIYIKLSECAENGSFGIGKGDSHIGR